MSTMTKPANTLKQIDRIVRQEMAIEHGCARGKVKPTYVLRKDGDTDKYTIDGEGRISVERVAGHVTLGNVVNPSDLPCVIC